MSPVAGLRGVARGRAKGSSGHEAQAVPGPGRPPAGGGDYCPSTGTAGWGTIFTVGAPCGNTGYVLYFNQHSGAYVTFTNGNDNRVYLNGPGTCLKQQDP